MKSVFILNFKTCLFMICLVLGFVGWSESFAEEKRKPSVLAIIHKSPRGVSLRAALLEERLSKNKNFVLVDRQHIDDIFKEQSLIKLSGYASGAGRISLCKLLGADLLIFITEEKGPVEHSNIVISELTYGLRLCVTKIIHTEKINDDLLLFEAEVNKAANKNRQKVKAICAVPPFLNKDLSSQNNHLQGAYAHLLENDLLVIPGVFVVELAEAQELSKEFSLNGTEISSRGLVFYLLGEFRFDSHNSQKPPYVKLLIKQSNQLIGERIKRGLSIKTGVTFFRDAVKELLAVQLKNHVAFLKTKDEHLSITSRAKVHYLLGNFEEAVQLFEASFLLQNHQPEAHFLAMSAIGRGYRKRKVSAMRSRKSLDLLDSLKRFDNAQRHLGFYLEQSELNNNSSGVYNSISETFGDINYFANSSASLELKGEVYAFRKRMRNMYIAKADIRLSAGDLNSVYYRLTLVRWHRHHSYFRETLKENFRARIRGLETLARVEEPYADSLIRDLILNVVKSKYFLSDEYSWFLSELDRLDHPQVKKTINSLRKSFAREKSTSKTIVRPKLKKKITPNKLPEYKLEKNDVTFSSIALIRDDGKRIPNGPMKSWHVLKCSEKLDFIWVDIGIKTLYLMKEKGKLRFLKKFKFLKNVRLGRAQFDGEKIWISVGGHQPRVFVINPKTEVIIEFTSKDGLPAFEGSVSASMGIGRVCFSGFNEKGSFVAILTLSKSGKKKVKVIHEAIKSFDPLKDKSVQKSDLGIRFYPYLMMADHVRINDSWLIFISCRLPSGLGRRMLLINIKTSEISILPTIIESHISYHDIGKHKESMYWITREGLREFNFSSKNNKTIKKVPQVGPIVFYNGYWHIASKSWWISEDVRKPFQKLNGEIPGSRPHLYKFYKSAFYGLILKAVGDDGWQNFQVNFIKNE